MSRRQLIHKLLYTAAVLSLGAVLVCLVFIMEMYDLSPQNWGPQGVAIAEWSRVWTEQRDKYVSSVFYSLVAFIILVLLGLCFDPKRGGRLKSPWRRPPDNISLMSL